MCDLWAGERIDKLEPADDLVPTERLVRIVEEPSPDGLGSARRTPSAVEPEEFNELQARAQVLEHVGTYVGTTSTVTGRSEAIPLNVTRMSAAFFPMLGERPMLGRSFEVVEETASSPPFTSVSGRNQ